MSNTLIIFAAKYLYLLILLITLIYFLRLPKLQKKDFILLAVFTLPAIFIASRIAAMLYFDPRPFVAGHFTPLIPHAPDNGFVSDHTLLASAAAMLVFFFDKKWSLGLWALTVFVGLGRVLAGLHHTIDILGAAFISIIVAVLTDRLLRSSKIIHYKNY